MNKLSPKEEIAFCCGTCADKNKMMQDYDDLLKLAIALATVSQSHKRYGALMEQLNSLEKE